MNSVLILGEFKQTNKQKTKASNNNHIRPVNKQACELTSRIIWSNWNTPTLPH